MRAWEAASLAFFSYLVLVAPTAAGAGRARVTRILVLAAAGMAATILVARLPYLAAIHDWLAPPALLLVGYWTSGLLYLKPRARQEERLLAFDRRAGVAEAARALPRGLVEVLELAYAGIYPLIPLALILHLFFSPEPDAERFWAVILATDYCCFATMPWVQTRPPRALDPSPPWPSRARRLNLHVLQTASVGVNTFPSGHAAEALAAALLVAGSPAPVVGFMAAAALAVTAGAVLGRYHYLFDALAGWVLAFVMWIWLA